MRMHEACGILTLRTHLAWNKNAKVKLYIYEAKLCICSAWFLMHLSSHGIKERCVDDGVTVRCSWFVYFFSCKGLVDNKYSRNIERIFEMIFLDLLFTSTLQGKKSSSKK